MFSRRQEQIIYYLLKEVNIADMDALCTMFAISERTLRKDISEINLQLSKQGMEIVYVRKRGYCIKEADRKPIKSILLENEKYSIYQPETNEERELYIFFLLLWETDYVSLEQIAQEIYMSKGTVYKDVQKVREVLKQVFGLSLEVSKTKGFRLHTTEMKKREIISYIILNHRFRYKYLLKMFHKYKSCDEEEYNAILYLLHEWVNENRFAVSKTELINFTLEIQIWISRIKYGFMAEEITLESYMHFSFPFKKLEKISGLQWTENEKRYLSYILSNKKFIILNNTFYDLKLSNIIDVFLDQVQCRLNHEISFMSEEVEKLKVYTYTLIQLLKRSLHDMRLLDLQVQKEYPLFYSLSLYLGPLIKEEYDVDLTEIEYEYITLFLVAMIYYQKQEKKVLLISDYPYPVIFYFIKKLKTQFQNFHIIGIANTEQYDKQFSNAEYDLALSTNRIKNAVNSKILYVNLHVDKDCIMKIQQYLDSEQ